MKKTINFKVNGIPVIQEVNTKQTLLKVLREALGITSPKYGCGKGECGACTVLMDGKSVRSCIILAVEADGSVITTVEGFQKNGLTDVQKAFMKHNAFQCGFCAPGFIVSTEEFLKENPTPNEEEIREALAGNLCRCTGYQNIVNAINEIAENRGGGK